MLIPNAADTVGVRYDVLDQAEPDALDFEILGNLGRTYVYSGGQVTSTGSATAVAVAACICVIDGYIITANAVASQALPTAPSDKRFDLVIIRKVTNTTGTVMVLQGINSATNPTYPKSRSLITTTFDPALNFDADTDVVLAAIYRPASSVITDARIVDKRVLSKVAISRIGVSAPTPGTASEGALFKKTGVPSGTGSGMYVGDSSGTWTELAANSGAGTGPYIPIGGMVGWPTTVAVPTGYLEAVGGTQLISTYPSLAAIYGTQHGGNGTTTFGIPNYSTSVPKGTATTSNGQATSPGQTTGVDSTNISAGQLPLHSHDMGSHTHTYAHSHGIDHSHAGSNTGFVSNDHSHSGSTSTDNYTHNHAASADGNVYFLKQNFAAGSSGVSTVNAGIAGPVNEAGTGNDFHQHNHTFTTGGISANHTHSTSTPAMSGSTVSQSASTSSGPSTNTTGNAGSSSALSLVQASTYIRWIIRAL
jgi:microcystin-dependent protein